MAGTLLFTSCAGFEGKEQAYNFFQPLASSKCVKPLFLNASDQVTNKNKATPYRLRSALQGGHYEQQQKMYAIQ